MIEDSVALIHQDLAQEVLGSLDVLYDIFRRDGGVDPCMIVWPYETVNFEGEQVNDAIPIQLPEDRAGWPGIIAEAAKRTSAWAVALYEQRPDAIVVIFESPIGTSSWHIPIEDHGDVRALGDISDVKVDTDYVGAVWKPTTPASATRAGTQH